MVYVRESEKMDERKSIVFLLSAGHAMMLIKGTNLVRFCHPQENT